ncbi:hypothetical protein [Nitrincola sp.]|uniref:DUF7415 domain-containing protein n=1 Tax=Nitrincola sp. TaxID=1926584 RepID=UPI003A915E71
MKSINWNQMSGLGLIERINREILHPLGLAVSRDVETGTSTKVLVADDGIWEYPSDMQTTIISDDEVKAKLMNMPNGEPKINADGWVSVLERLPPKENSKASTSDFVDVFDGEERWPDCYYCFYNEEFIWNDTGEAIPVNATHWKAIKLPRVEG